jgi:hypothetical protein
MRRQRSLQNGRQGFSSDHTTVLPHVGHCTDFRGVSLFGMTGLTLNYSLGDYSLGDYSLGDYSLGDYSLGVYSLGVYSLCISFGTIMRNSLHEILHCVWFALVSC